MINELNENEICHVSGGDAFTQQWGRWAGAAPYEYNAHPIGAMFGIGGILVAHYISN